MAPFIPTRSRRMKSSRGGHGDEEYVGENGGGAPMTETA
jgi:hypothetical protein